MAMAVILFSFYFYPVLHAQCIEENAINQSITFSNISSGPDSYYRNLIVQDIGLSENIPFRDVILKYDYMVRFSLEQCHEHYYELKVNPVGMTAYPLDYRGVDIAASVLPEKADLVFHLYNEMGILTDSIFFTGIDTGFDSNFYALVQRPDMPQEGKLKARFARAYFYFTRHSYDIFRDRLMEIDRYYAASQLADSTLRWTRMGFLEEVDDLPDLVLRQIELVRITRLISATFAHFMHSSGEEDTAGLGNKILHLRLLNTRYRTLILLKSLSDDGRNTRAEWKELAGLYGRQLEYYENLAITGDFRNMDLFSELSSPVRSNADLLLYRKAISELRPADGMIARQVAEGFVNAFIRQGQQEETTGNQIRALEYYEAANKLAVFSGYANDPDSLFNLICSAKKDIVDSYLAISRRAFQTQSPSMAVSYYRNALEILDHQRTGLCSRVTMDEFNRWLFISLENKARELMASRKYSKAQEYLNEIENECVSNATFRCPEDLQDLMDLARAGIYRELISRAGQLYEQEEWAEAETLLKQAVEMRQRAGTAVAADPVEIRLMNGFRQNAYSEYVDEGIRNMNWGESNIALYYFNKAKILENETIMDPFGNLGEYRQEAARQVIGKLMSETRARVLAYDFEGYQLMMSKVAAMVEEYRFGPNDPVMAEYEALKNDALIALCGQVREEFHSMVEDVVRYKEAEDYIEAKKLAEKAVEYSLDHLECGIDDSKAWYEKVVLEPLAEYQQKETSLKVYNDVTPKEYQAAYQELSGYYYRNKLIRQGILLESVYEKVLHSDDIDFLVRYLDLYVQKRNLEQGLLTLKRIRELQADPSGVSEEQKDLAELFARRDVILYAEKEPWVLMNSYVGEDKWFATFRWSYRMNWILHSGGKLRDWPVIWKK
jgi:hypothetical protein